MNYDLMILGGGPGGYAAAIRAGQLGMRTALIEKEGVGGTCLHHGCIPSKALLKSAEVFSIIQHASEFGIHCSGEVRPDVPSIISRSQKITKRLHRGLTHLMKVNKVEVHSGVGRFLSNHEIEVLGTGEEGSKKIQAERIILATGSRVRPWPSLAVDGRRVLTSDEALMQSTLPRSVVVIGGGAVGVELAYFYSVFGAVVMIVEAAPSLLPTEDREVSALLKRSFEKRGITVITDARIDSIHDQGEHFKIKLAGIEEAMRTDAVLVAIGRIPNTDGLDIKKAGITVDEKTRAVVVDEKMQTSQEGIWAIGDVTTRPVLAHGAMAQGVYVAESMAGIERPPIDLLSVPNAIYCQPEVASVGLTEEKARAEGHKIKVAKFPFSGNSRAVLLHETDGFVKIVSDPYGQILGAHLIGPGVTELISEFVLAKSLEATALDIKRAIHPHPTLSEGVMEAGGAIFGQAIHI